MPCVDRDRRCPRLTISHFAKQSPSHTRDTELEQPCGTKCPETGHESGLMGNRSRLSAPNISCSSSIDFLLLSPIIQRSLTGRVHTVLSLELAAARITI